MSHEAVCMRTTREDPAVLGFRIGIVWIGVFEGTSREDVAREDPLLYK